MLIGNGIMLPLYVFKQWEEKLIEKYFPQFWRLESFLLSCKTLKLDQQFSCSFQITFLPYGLVMRLYSWQKKNVKNLYFCVCISAYAGIWLHLMWFIFFWSWCGSCLSFSNRDGLISYTKKYKSRNFTRTKWKFTQIIYNFLIYIWNFFYCWSWNSEFP